MKYLPIGKYYGAKSPQATLNYIEPLFESIQIICKNNDIYIKQLTKMDFKNTYKAVGAKSALFGFEDAKKTGAEKPPQIKSIP